MRRMVAVGCAVLLALSACASSRTKVASPSRTRAHEGVLASCPATAHAAGTLATAPRSAFACLLNEPPVKRIPGSTLPRDDAGTLARLILSAPISHSRCRSGTGVQVLVRFYYPASHADVVIDALGCRVADVAGTIRALPKDLADFAFGAAGGPQPSHAPDLLGLPLTQAVAAARHAGALLEVIGVLVDALSPPGSVLLQSPGDWAVVAAVPPASACRLDELGFQYGGGGAGTGNDVGTLTIRNTSSVWCVLRGPILVTGLSAKGLPVTTTVRSRASDVLELSPRADPVPENADPPRDEFVAQLLLVAEYRDDVTVANGMCVRFVVPARWRISLGSDAVTVPNGAGRFGRPIGSLGLVTCRGRLRSAELSRG